MPSLKPNASKSKVASPPARPAFVLGSRPQNLRQSAPGTMRIRPQTGVTQYGKGVGQGNPGGSSFGDTGQTNMS